MTKETEGIFNDNFIGEPPAKRAVGYIQNQREKGRHVAGIYCGYAPVELMHALDVVPAVLCAFANATIEVAEAELPANLCPLIKSSFGFILSDTCPFFTLSDVVIAETTCDGKKKMFELISDIKPMHVMDLPQLPNEEVALTNWTEMIKKLKIFLERTLNVSADDEAIEKAIVENNEKNRLVNKMLDFGSLDNPVLGWNDMHDIIFYATPGRGNEINDSLQKGIEVLESRVKNGYIHGDIGAPRVLITGCPTAGDASKVFKIIEESGGVIVAIDSCVGLKPFAEYIAEGTGDPIRAIAERYLKIPCACMTPNERRLSETDKL
ncbi:MAG: 2-hydroxyacyl-CoA dehydratase family protein, partial [Spirochaetota bacterium]|nr:2-hydroxyacyl-CoA dehydratase family protein [Spirochaetota bacterium]